MTKRMFYWDGKDLRRDLKEIERMLKLAKTDEEREELTSYIALAKRLVIENGMDDEDEDVNYLSSLAMTTPIFEMYHPFIVEFKRKLDSYFLLERVLKIEKQKKLVLSKNDMVDLINELFKSTNKEIYELYSKLYARKNNHIRINDSDEFDGCMIFMPGVNKPYITVAGRRDEAQNTLLNIAHEEGHSIASLMNPERYVEDEKYFLEIESLFFEMIGNDFFEKELNDSYFTTNSEIMLGNYYFTADDIIDEKRVSDAYFKMGNPTLKEIADALKDPSIEVMDEASDYSIDRNYKYLFSYIVAIELYEVYRRDKDLAIDMLKRIVKSGKEESEYTNITSTVKPNKTLTKFANRTANRMKRATSNE